jgi:prohibitin 2
MNTLIVLAMLAAVGFLIARFVRRAWPIRVIDSDGRSRPATPGLRRLVLSTGLVVTLGLSLALAVRVVPVGHGLVVFNTVTRSFRLARQGVTLVPPLISQTQLYDLRRLEYTMSSVAGEGRKAEIDDSLWSPTQEGLQVGIDLTVWHHLDPARVVDIHKGIGPEYEERILRPAVRSVIRLVISEYAVMEVYSAKRAAIQAEINDKIRAFVEKDGFLIDDVVLRDVHFTEQFSKAIEAKQIAQQSAEQMKYVLEKEQREAERKVIEAQGRSKAIDTINDALQRSPSYIRYLYVDKLSDKISVIVSDQSTIMDLKGMLEKK